VSNENDEKFVLLVFLALVVLDCGQQTAFNAI
jgi:hypothetical protein